MRKQSNPSWDLRVIPDFDEMSDLAVVHDRWDRTQTLRSDENAETYDSAVWAVPVRVPSAALVEAITDYWKAHLKMVSLHVYDSTMGCGLTLWSGESEHIIAGSKLVGDIDYCEGKYVEWVVDGESVWHGQMLCWWDGSELKEVPLRGAQLRIVKANDRVAYCDDNDDDDDDEEDMPCQ